MGESLAGDDYGYSFPLMVTGYGKGRMKVWGRALRQRECGETVMTSIRFYGSYVEVLKLETGCDKGRVLRCL